MMTATPELPPVRISPEPGTHRPNDEADCESSIGCTVPKAEGFPCETELPQSSEPTTETTPARSASEGSPTLACASGWYPDAARGLVHRHYASRATSVRRYPPLPRKRPQNQGAQSLINYAGAIVAGVSH